MSNGANASAYFGHPRLEMQRFVPADARVMLDVGCGAGAFAGGLKQVREQLVVWGVEYDAGAADQAREILDQVHVGDACQIVPTLPREHFDCICLNDILEHLVDPAALLRDLAPLLAPGGCLVVSLPNVRYFHNVVNLVLKGRWDYTDEGICDRTHLRFFTRGSMLDLMRDAGYRVDNITGINPTGAAAFKLCNLLTWGFLGDMRYLQFALVARPGNENTGGHEKADPSP